MTEITPTQLAVLRLIADRLTTHQIAAKLYIGHRTVGSHVNELYRRLGATNRAHAVSIAHRQGLL